MFDVFCKIDIADAYYAGWNRRESVDTKNTVCIHHPEGDVKKITFDFDAPVFGSRTANNYIRESYWRIKEWDLGTTEHGSSGSPLFDENHLIIGCLSGGRADCYTNIDDFYRRFDMSWDYFQEPSQQLKAWLDPLQTGAKILNGYDPNAISEGVDAAIQRINKPEKTYCSQSTILPEVVIQNMGTEDLLSAIVTFQLNDEEIVSKLWTGALKTGETGIVQFSETTFPEGNAVCRAIVSAPNGKIDNNKVNDNLVLDIFGQKQIDDLVVDGSTYICNENLHSIFSTQTEGKYVWNVSGGEIDGADNLGQVEINWDEWGERKVDLNVTNQCNSVDANTLYVYMVEKSLDLEIQLGENGESACWKLEDCAGNVIIEDCELEPNTIYTRTICIPDNCYRFGISSKNEGVQGYTLKDGNNKQDILNGNELSGDFLYDINLNGSENKGFFNLYPNPVNSLLTIEASFIELYKNSYFTIFNFKGQQIMPTEKMEGRKVLDLSNFQKGIYVIEITSDYGRYLNKFIKL